MVFFRGHIMMCLVGLASLSASDAYDVSGSSTRIMFVGNSFTFVNDLPHQLKNIAHSLGDEIDVANSTIGGCTLFHQMAPDDARTAELLKEDWDYIVLQDYSILPTVYKARQEYMAPAVKSFVSQKKQAKIVMYMTWGYHDGNTAPCPSSDNTICFPKGSLASLTEPPCNSSSHFNQLTGTYSCMSYALVRGYLSMKENVGADMVAPCNLAWQIVRDANESSTNCYDYIDAQYQTKSVLPHVAGSVPGGAMPGFMLYRVFGSSIDKHPNVAGQYLNALTFYSTLFGKSPVGAAPPLNTGSPSAGDRPLTSSEIHSLQVAAYGAVQQCGSACGLK